MGLTLGALRAIDAAGLADITFDDEAEDLANATDTVLGTGVLAAGGAYAATEEVIDAEEAEEE